MPNGGGYALPGNVGGGQDPFSLDYFDQNPRSAYEDWLYQIGLSDESPMARFARSRYDTYHNQYEASLARDPFGRAASGDPNLYFRNFLNSVNPKSEFEALGPRDRGESPSTGVPRLRWLTSII